MKWLIHVNFFQTENDTVKADFFFGGGGDRFFYISDGFICWRFKNNHIALMTKQNIILV